MINMIILVQNTLGYYGFDVEIYNNKKSIYKNNYFYGINSSSSRKSTTKSKPYVSDIIMKLTDKYNVDDINIYRGKNVNIDITDFISEYMPGILRSAI